MPWISTLETCEHTLPQSLKVPSSLSKELLGFCSEPQHQICCMRLNLTTCFQHMVVNHILILIIDEQNSVCQDNTCCNDLATKKNSGQGIGLLHMPKEDH